MHDAELRDISTTKRLAPELAAWLRPGATACASGRGRLLEVETLGHFRDDALALQVYLRHDIVEGGQQ